MRVAALNDVHGFLEDTLAEQRPSKAEFLALCETVVVGR